MTKRAALIKKIATVSINIAKALESKNLKKLLKKKKSLVKKLRKLRKKIVKFHKNIKNAEKGTLKNIKSIKALSIKSIISDNDRARINSVLNYWYPDEKSKIRFNEQLT